jgi:hypothetical protein
MTFTWNVFRDFYLNDNLFLNGQSGTIDDRFDTNLQSEVSLVETSTAHKKGVLPPILDVPYLDNLFCIYGVNRVCGNINQRKIE